MVVLWWTLTALFIFLHKVMCYVEMVEEVGFDNTTFRLTCIHLDSIIVIYDATYQPFKGNNRILEDNTSCNPRLALNQRCSGVGHCSFILTEDCPGADKWGAGKFKIKYACISEEEQTRYCNQEIILPSRDENRSSEGYVFNPGYPKFYLGNQDCRWKITAPFPQKIKVTILDLSLLGNSENCQDLLVIKDSEQTVFTSCLQQEPPIQITSVTDTLEINFSTSELLTPRRGVLFHFTAVGCFTPKIPKDGYLMFKNDTSATFSCCAGYTFPDSCEKIKTLKCLGYKWDRPVVDCDNKSRNNISGPKELVNKNQYLPVKLNKDDMSELIAPIVLIIALFAINAVVLFFILRYRKRKAATPACTEEELKTFSVTNNGNQIA